MKVEYNETSKLPIFVEQFFHFCQLVCPMNNKWLLVIHWLASCEIHFFACWFPFVHVEKVCGINNWIAMGMGPRKSRHQAYLLLAQPKKIFDVDDFVVNQVPLTSNARVERIKVVSTGQRVDREENEYSELEIHFWINFDDSFPYYSEFVRHP